MIRKKTVDVVAVVRVSENNKATGGGNPYDSNKY